MKILLLDNETRFMCRNQHRLGPCGPDFGLHINVSIFHKGIKREKEMRKRVGTHEKEVCNLFYKGTLNLEPSSVVCTVS